MELITQFINDLGNFIFIPVIFLVLMKTSGASAVGVYFISH